MLRKIYMIKNISLADHSCEQIVRIRWGRAEAQDRQYIATNASWARIKRFARGPLERFDLPNGDIQFIKTFLVR